MESIGKESLNLYGEKYFEIQCLIINILHFNTKKNAKVSQKVFDYIHVYKKIKQKLTQKR